VQAGAALGTSLVVLASEATTPIGLNLSSADVGDEGLYCCFSPRARPSPQLEPHVSAAVESEVITDASVSMLNLEVDALGASKVAFTTSSLEPSQPLVSMHSSSSLSSIAEGEPIARDVLPMLHIMPELEERCASMALPLSVGEHTKVDSSATLTSPERLDVTTSPIPPLTEHNPDALLVKEVCDLLSGLETAIPGLGRAIACLLTGTPIKGKSTKASDYPRTSFQKEKSLKCKDKKSGVKGKHTRLLDG
jgi:hypothetical protein